MSNVAVSDRDKLHFSLRHVLQFIDYNLLAVVLLILVLGACAVGSATMFSTSKSAVVLSGLFQKHVIAIVVGAVLSAFVLKVPSSVWQSLSLFILITAILMLMLVLVPGIGREVNGASRWLALGGANFQPSEFAKLAFVIYMSGFVIRHHENLQRTILICIMPAVLLMLITGLLLLEPDFGSAAVILGLALTMLFIGGVKVSQVLMVLSGCVLIFAFLAVAEPYRVRRLTGFLDPWEVQFDAGYQLVQALIAIGRGEAFGVGYGASIQKLDYLPEPHTDFLFAIFAEEFGFVGIVLLVACFLYLGYRGFLLALSAIKAEKYFAGYLVAGIVSWFTFQAFINMGVNLGMLPTKGLTLPFMSYGRSSLLMMMIAFAMVLRVSYEVRVAGAGAKRTRGVAYDT